MIGDVTSEPDVGGAYGTPVRPRRAVPVLIGVSLALVALWLLTRTAVSYYSVSGHSMEPTLHAGERVALDTGDHTPKVGDLVILHPPTGADPTTPVCAVPDEGSGFTSPCGIAGGRESSTTLIKRVVAGPGDQIAVVGGHAVRNGVTEAEPFLTGCEDRTRCDFTTPVRIPEGEYFVLGDNRALSSDGRFWGPVPSSWIIGTVVRCLPLGTLCQPRH